MTNILKSLRSGLLMGITVSGDGTVTDQGGHYLAGGDGVVVRTTPPAPVQASEKVADPNAPPAKKTPEEEAAEAAAAEALKNETPEQKTAREASEAAAREEAAKKWSALAPEEVTEIDGRADLNDAQKASMKDATVEMKTTGDLSPESRDAAAKSWGVPRSMVDAYVESIKPAYKAAIEATASGAKAPPPAVKSEGLTPEQTVQFNTRMDALYKDYGGKEGWDAFSKWATSGGLTEAEQAELVAGIDASPRLGVLAAKDLVAKFQAQGGSKGGPLDVTRGGNSPAKTPQGGPQGFNNQAEQNAALRERGADGRPKMETDTAYRKNVEARMAVSDFRKGAFM